MAKFKRLLKKVNKEFNKHGVLLGFLINLALILITAFSVYKTNQFSRESIIQTDASLNLTKVQLKQNQASLQLTKDQLQLSNDQFQILLKQSKYKDSIQEINDRTQEKLNLAQMQINKDLLNASRSQAKTAEEQYKFQLFVNKDQSYQNRPIFFLNQVEIDSIKVKPDLYITYHFKNIGKRPARIKYSIFFTYNKRLNAFDGKKLYTGQTINDQLLFIRGQQIKRIIHYDPETYYYVVLDYSDVEMNTSLKYVAYFKIGNMKNTVQQVSLTPNEKQLFLTKLLYKEISDKEKYIFLPSN